MTDENWHDIERECFEQAKLALASIPAELPAEIDQICSPALIPAPRWS